ncbi:hypothetical protein H2248_010325 [Termitomyces sp. 'cryptogamus']|nr:hypothetical protein H2248_010325 [Termitomyces sp. 'cryptogamus']
MCTLIRQIEFYNLPPIFRPMCQSLVKEDPLQLLYVKMSSLRTLCLRWPFLYGACEAQGVTSPGRSHLYRRRSSLCLSNQTVFNTRGTKKLPRSTTQKKNSIDDRHLDIHSRNYTQAEMMNDWVLFTLIAAAYWQKSIKYGKIGLVGIIGDT